MRLLEQEKRVLYGDLELLFISKLNLFENIDNIEKR